MSIKENFEATVQKSIQTLFENMSENFTNECVVQMKELGFKMDEDDLRKVVSSALEKILNSTKATATSSKKSNKKTKGEHTCEQKMKSGLRKGEPCGAPTNDEYDGVYLCKKHSKSGTSLKKKVVDDTKGVIVKEKVKKTKISDLPEGGSTLSLENLQVSGMVDEQIKNLNDLIESQDREPNPVQETIHVPILSDEDEPKEEKPKKKSSKKKDEKKEEEQPKEDKPKKKSSKKKVVEEKEEEKKEEEQPKEDKKKKKKVVEEKKEEEQPKEDKPKKKKKVVEEKKEEEKKEEEKKEEPKEDKPKKKNITKKKNPLVDEFNSN